MARLCSDICTPLGRHASTSLYCRRCPPHYTEVHVLDILCAQECAEHVTHVSEVHVHSCVHMNLLLMFHSLVCSLTVKLALGTPLMLGYLRDNIAGMSSEWSTYSTRQKVPTTLA